MYKHNLFFPSRIKGNMEMSYFVVKCTSIKHLQICIDSGVWAFRMRLNPPQPSELLETAHRKGRVILIFSVNNQHGWHGFCESKYPSNNNSSIEEETEQNKLHGLHKNVKSEDDGWFRFPVDWLQHFQNISTHECLPLEKTKHLILVDGSPVNQARNWQQMTEEAGDKLCKQIGQHHDFLLQEKINKEKEKEKHKEKSFFKDEEESVTTPDQIVESWRTLIEKVQRDLGKVILACPFGSQR